MPPRCARRCRKGCGPSSSAPGTTTALVFGAVIVFIAILNPVGWILSSTFLFWTISYALGSKRKLFDFGIAIIFASCTQLAFSAGLGLNLPSGFLGGIL